MMMMDGEAANDPEIIRESSVGKIHEKSLQPRGERHLKVIVAVVFLIDYRLRVSIFNQQQLERAVASAKLASNLFLLDRLQT